MNNDILIKDSEAYNQIFEYSQGYLILVDTKGKVLDLNMNFLTDLRYTKNEIIGKNIGDFIPQEDKKKSLLNISKIISQKNVSYLHIKTKTKDNNFLDVRTSGRGSSVYDKNNNIIGVLVYALNITEVIKSKEKYQLLSDNIKEGIYSADSRGRFVNVNKAMTDIFGYSEKELIGMQAWELADKSIQESVRRKIIKKIINRDSSPLQVKCVRKDKKEIFVEVSVEKVLEKGRAFGVVFDVTDKKKVQEGKLKTQTKYKNLFESIADGIWVIDSKFNIVDANDKISEILGYTKEEMIGSSIFNYYNNLKSVKESVTKNLLETLKGEGVYVEREFVTKLGDIIDVSISTKKIDREENLIIESIRNISEIKDLKKKVKKLDKNLLNNLTNNEKKVFYAISVFPEYSDIEISKKTSIKRSTVTSIKNRLKKERYFKILRIPSLSLLRCNILSISRHTFNRDSKNSYDNNINENNYPNIIYHLSTKNYSVAVSVLKDLSDLRGNALKYSLQDSSNSHIDDFKYIYFQKDSLSLFNFFNYSKILKNIFNIKDDFELNNNMVNQNSNIKLNDKDKKIVLHLVKYPDATDTEIASMSKVSRITVSKLKRKLLSEGYLRTVIVPNFTKILVDPLFIMTHFLLSSEKNIKIINSYKRTNFMGILGKDDLIDFSIYESYSDYNKSINNFLYKSKIEKELIKDIQPLILPLNSVNIENLDFSKITEKSLKENY